MASSANAGVLFATGFESPNYTSGNQLATVSGWSGSGQDTTGWLITSQTTLGGPKAGSQWILASAPTAAVSSRFQWRDIPVTDFSVNPIISAGASVKLIDGTNINRSTLAGIQIYDAATTLSAALYVFNDVENLLAAAAPGWYIYQLFESGNGFVYTLPGTPTNTYLELALSINYATGAVAGSVNGVTLPNVGTTTSTDFHDLDMMVGRASTTAGGNANRAGFDNYGVVSSAPVPEPVAGLVFVPAAMMMRRRRA